MSGLTLTLVEAPDFALDMSVLTPAALAGKRLTQIRAIKLQQGRKRGRREHRHIQREIWRLDQR